MFSSIPEWIGQEKKSELFVFHQHGLRKKYKESESAESSAWTHTFRIHVHLQLSDDHSGSKMMPVVLTAIALPSGIMSGR